MANVHGLGSAKRGKAPKDTESFTSQGHTSGTAVFRSTNRGEPAEDPIKSIVDQANVQRRTGGQDGGALDRDMGVITLYKNGFKYGDQPFRDAKDPKNRDFLASLRKGELPQEIEQEVRRHYGPKIKSVGVSLVNKSGEMYEPPNEEEKFDFMKSKGHSMTSGSKGSSFAATAPREVQVDASKPTASIQIVLHTRQRHRLKVNLSHTVQNIFEHVMWLSKHPGPFDLIAGFPPKPLRDRFLTVQEAKLAGSSVQQKVTK